MQQFEKFVIIKAGHNVNFRTEPKVTDTNVIAVVKAGEVFQTFDVLEGTTWCVARRESTGQIGYLTTLEQYVEDHVPDWLVKAKAVINHAEKYMLDPTLHPYEFGSSRTTDKTFDCSDLIQWCYDEVLGIHLPWDSRAQSKYGAAIGIGYDTLRTGDAIFFDTNGDGVINHVALYVFPHKILHTYSKTSDTYNRDMVKIRSDKGGITYSRYEDGTSWRKNTTGARRYLN